MKILRPSTQFKKDAKRIRNNPRKAEALLRILQILSAGLPIPESYRPHTLQHDYAGCMECHVENDFLLIWIDHETNEIDLVRLGSHSELFGKGAKR
ncbi:MAG: type II toxin-antitoxin system YafQ family toxin [bacterium]|nr:type II toxin-antitoxin system YafQ family toxin [bacterium]